MNQAVLIAATLLLPFLYALFLSLKRRRERVRLVLKRAAIAEPTYLLVWWYLSAYSVPSVSSLAIGALAGIGLALTVAPTRQRGRHIPRRERRIAIARWEAKTGLKYDPQRYELDHEVPFARHGTHGADNLRVIPKAHNRAKSDRSAWWDVLWFRR